MGVTDKTKATPSAKPILCRDQRKVTAIVRAELEENVPSTSNTRQKLPRRVG